MARTAVAAFVLAAALLVATAAAAGPARALAQTKPAQQQPKQQQPVAKPSVAVPEKAAKAAQSGSSFELYNCGGARRLGKTSSDNMCCQLCWCLGNQSENKVFGVATVQDFCKRKCSECVASAWSCASESAALPEVCAQGLQFNPTVKDLVNKCVGIYLADGTNALGRVPGC